MQDFINRIPPRLRRHGAALALAVASLIALVADYPLLALPLAASALGITIFKRGQRKKAAAAEQERRKLRRDSSTARDADRYRGRGLLLRARTAPGAAHPARWDYRPADHRGRRRQRDGGGPPRVR